MEVGQESDDKNKLQPSLHEKLSRVLANLVEFLNRELAGS